MFHDKHIKRKKTEGKKIIACDYGTGNPTVFLLLDVDGEKIHVQDEYYYSGRETGVQKTDSQYAADMMKFIEKNGIRRNDEIIVDPSAASFIVELRQRGLNVQKANNAVIDGIRNVSMKLSKNEISVDPECEKTIEEFHTYSWDENAQNKGEDKPLKENDHCMDALRYGVMSRLRTAKAVRSLAM